MKRKNKILTLLLAFGLTLVGCDKDDKKVADNDGDKGTNTADSNNGEGHYGENSGNNGNEENENHYIYDPNRSDWNDEEKAILQSFFHGADVPYMNIVNETELKIDSETGYATKTAPVCSMRILDMYAALFDESWELLGEDEDDEGEELIEATVPNVMSAAKFADEVEDDEEDVDVGVEPEVDDDEEDPDATEESYFYYEFRKAIQTEDGVRYAFACIYGGVYSEEYQYYVPSSDGTGVFVLDVYDPYVYSWPTYIVEYVLESFELSDAVPAFEGADYIQINDSLFMLKSVSFFCYTEDASSLDKYAALLEGLDYEIYYTDEYDYFFFTNEAQEITIIIGYDDEYKSLDITISAYQEVELPDPYDADKADWNDEEKAVFSNNYYGVDLPYKNIENESYLKMNAYGDCAVKTAPNCSKELLASYAALFDDSWEDFSDLEESEDEEDDGFFYYCLKKVVTTEEGDRNVIVRFYGGTYDAFYDDYDNNNDGSGTFVLEVYDPYLYEWPADVVNAFQEDNELEDEVPAYTTAPKYQFEEDYLGQYVAVFCYVPETEVEVYVGMLTEAEYSLYKTDDDGYEYYAKDGGDTSVCVGYDEDYGTLDIYVEVYVPVPTINFDGDSLTQAAFNLTPSVSQYGEHTAIGASGAEYFGNMASSYGIQIRNQNKPNQYSGIVVTKSGGTVEAIGIRWNVMTTQERKIYIYASNEAFTIEDMYKNRVTKVGEVDNSTEVSVFDDFKSSYAYVGIMVSKGAAYLDEIVIAWSQVQ